MKPSRDEAPDGAAGRWAGFEDVPTVVTVRVGETRCSLAKLSELAPGEVLPLDRPVGAPFDLFANGVRIGGVQPVAAGEGIGIKLVDAAQGDGDARD